MPVDVNTLREHVIPMADFSIKWRFTDKRWDKLPGQVVEQLRPLDKWGSELLWQYARQIHSKGYDPHSTTRFRLGVFRNVDVMAIKDDNELEVNRWLSQRGIPLDNQVFLSWDNFTGMIVPWRLLVEYWDAFFYPSSDDLTIYDGTLDWAVFFDHENEIYFGTNNSMPFEPRRGSTV